LPAAGGATRADTLRINRTKLHRPGLAEHLVQRPRIEQRLHALLDRHPLLLVYAAAGSGKTTAVAQTLCGDDRMSWLTVDDGDTAPGRLLIYLEAALAERAPEAGGVAAAALEAGIAHGEAAGLLAESTEGCPIVLVIDNVDRLATSPAAVAVVNSLVRYAPASMRVALIGRREIALERAGLGLPRTVGSLAEEELAFTADEARAALAAAGGDPAGAADAVAATGGWVAGVLFGAGRRVATGGDETDALDGYLATEILDCLDNRERELLVRTALLDAVDAESTQRLGIADAAAVLGGLRSYRLPVTWEADGRALRCHPVFRDYLRRELGRRDRNTVRELRRRHGDILAGRGLFEDATEEYLAADASAAALSAADRAIGSVVDRLDLDVAARWLSRLPADALVDHPGLLTATLMVAIGREQFERGARAADELARAAERQTPQTLSMMAWCYWHVGRVNAARAVIADMPPGPESRVMRYLLTLNDNEPAPERERPPMATGDALDALLMRIHYASGRLREVREAPRTNWTPAVTDAWRIQAERAMGQLDLAHRHYRAALAENWKSVPLEGVVGPEILGDLGRADEAFRALDSTRSRIAGSRSVVFELLASVLEAWLLLRLRDDHRRALAVLEAISTRRELADYPFIAEQVATWTGLALLRSGGDGPARACLRRAVHDMIAGRRILELPTASVYLAEAALRAGDEDEADRASEQALDAARRQGSDHLLLKALSDFPSVLVRQLDAGADSRWRELGRVLATQTIDIGRPVAAVVHFHDLGAPRVRVDGQVVSPKITKSLEVLAVLAEAPEHRVDRATLLSSLFEARSDRASATYLRQAVHRLRELMPAGVELAIDRAHVKITGATIVTDSARFLRLLDEAAALEDQERLAALESALAMFASGEYLAGRDSYWIDARRAMLVERATDARFQAAELRFARDDHPTAQAHLDAVLAADPFEERAWRLTMRIAATRGDYDGALAAFRHCRRTFEEIGATPSPATRRLLDALRR